MKSTKNPIMDSKEYTKSLTTFMNHFDSDSKCLDYIVETKYKNGWRCPKSECGSKKYYLIKKRNIIRCSSIKCKYEKSVVADTIFRQTKKPLLQWFKAIYILATQEKHTSAEELRKQLELRSYKTALYWLDTIKKIMYNLESSKLCGDIAVDTLHLKTWNGGEENTLIACAVEIKYDKKREQALGQIKLEYIMNIRGGEPLRNFIIDKIKVGSSIMRSTDKCYNEISKTDYKHIIGYRPNYEKFFERKELMQKVEKDLKQWLGKTNRYVSIHTLQNYLNEYTFGFNRRENKAKAFTDVMEFAILGKDRNK